MKVLIPNRLNNRQTKQMFEKTNETMRIKVLLLLLLVTICTSMSAQVNIERENSLVVRDINSLLNSQGASQRTSGNLQTDSRNLEDLILKNQSSVYFSSGNINVYGEKPRNLYTDLNSLSHVSSADFLKDYVEIVIISIKNSAELNGTIDMSLLSSLKKLKYVYFVSDVNATESNFMQMIQNSSDKYSFYYKLEKKS